MLTKREREVLRGMALAGTLPSTWEVTVGAPDDYEVGEIIEEEPDDFCESPGFVGVVSAPGKVTVVPSTWKSDHA